MLSRWPLPRLANQTIVVPAEETSLRSIAPAARAGYAGILLFGARAPAELASQLAGLRRLVPGHLGWLVMTDEEGGGVQRMANLVGSLPWASQLGRSERPARIEALAASIGRKMLANGVNMDWPRARRRRPGGGARARGIRTGFARSRANAAVVAADGVAFMKGMLEAGVIPVVKHFPGLGGVSRNTDDGPAWTLPWRTLQRVALPPFVAAIAAREPRR